jgi:hypothetical protein
MSNNSPSATIRTRAKLRLRRKTIAIGLELASTLLLIATVLNASMFLSFPSPLIPSPWPRASAEMGDQDERTHSLLSSSSPSTISLSTSTSTSTSNDLRFSYSKLGVSSGDYQRISYDSETNFLRLNNVSTAIKENDSGRLSLSQGQSQSQSNKQISDSDQRNLQQMIEQNGFFQTNGIYPPTDARVNENYETLHALSVEMDDRVHSVIWTDTSENIPTVLPSIVKAIEKILSE